MTKFQGILLLLFLLVGCTTDSRTLSLIERAESVMIDHPDSALNMLRSVDTTTIYRERDMAHYRLALAESHYYLRQDDSRDSLASLLHDYYFTSDDHSKRARALYQYALSLIRQAEYVEAMYTLDEVEESLSRVVNKRLEALVHRSKGDIYNVNMLFQQAISEVEKAKLYFDECGLTQHSLHANLLIISYYIQSRDYDTALKLLPDFESKVVEAQDQYLLNEVLFHYCIIIVADEYAPLGNLLSRVDTQYLDEYTAVYYYSFSAIFEAYSGNFERAFELLATARESTSPDISFHKSLVDYAEYAIYLLRGDYFNAHTIYCQMIAAQDQLTLGALDNEVMRSQVEALAAKVASEQKLQQRMVVIYVLSVVVIVFVALVLVYLFVMHQRRYREQVSHYLDIISGFELMHSDNSSSSQLSSTIEQIYRQNLNEINDLCEIYYEQGGSSRLATKIFEQVTKNIDRLRNDVKRIEELESAVNLSRNDIMKRLRGQCPELSERDFRIALYTYAGFSNRAISLLVGCNSETLPKLKYGLRERIKRYNSVDVEELMAPLFNKKH